jgi:hypothetical protein
MQTPFHPRYIERVAPGSQAASHAELLRPETVLLAVAGRAVADAPFNDVLGPSCHAAIEDNISLAIRRF